MSSDFSELLHEAEKLTANIEGFSELPKIDRSLRQVLEESNNLFTRVTRTGSQDVQANLLLGSQGIDLPRIVQKLENISTKRTFEPITPTADTDIQSFLHNEIQNVIVGVIEDELKLCTESAKNSAWAHQKSEWMQEKTKIINAMSAPSRHSAIVCKQSLFLNPPPIISNKLGPQEALYASKIMDYNKSLSVGTQRVNLVNALAKTAEEFKDTKVNDMWQILKYMTQLPPFPSDKSVVEMRNSVPMIKILIEQAKSYLEDRYKTFMANVINENFAEARRGGMPGTYSLARSFVAVRLQGEYIGLQDGLVEDRPVWPIVYYCLRSGDLAAAIHCLKTAVIDNVEIIDLLELKLKKASNEEIQQKKLKLQVYYQRVMRSATDPFLRIVYDILCSQSNLDDHSEVAKTADDYLWLKLCFLQTKTKNDEIMQFYRNLQLTILEEYGESHYDAMNQPHLYFQMLVLTGQFEAAFEFLARVYRYQIHSVHMAISLHELHMLCLPLHANSALLTIDPMDPKPSRLLNITRLIMIYVQKFEMLAPREAAHYYYMLRNIKSDDGTSIFIKCIVDLATETREYYMLLGKIQPNGIRSPGFLDEFLSPDLRIEAVAQAVGDNLIKKAVFEDAIELFDIANNHEEVLTLLCTLLSQVVHQQTTEGSLRERLPFKINEISNRYSALGYNCSANCLSSFMILKKLLDFFDQYHSKQFGLALSTLDDIKLIPLHLNEVEERLSVFKRYSNDVCKVLPDVVLATMNILFAQYQKVKSNEFIPTKFQDVSQDKQLTYLRDQAKALTTFTAMLPYRMPGDTNSRLVQMEILMH